VALDTLVQSGEIPVRMGPKNETTGQSTVLENGKSRETRIFDGKVYNMETALKGDVAILRAWKVDEDGNCQFRLSTKTFGVIMAKAAKLTIVEAENIVPSGSIEPDNVHLPGIYVNRIVPSLTEKIIENRTLKQETTAGAPDKSEALKKRDTSARRTAKEFHDGAYVNLGVGIPTLAPSFLDPGMKVWIQSENGLLGVGPYPTEETIDA
jgi:3-oxoacid CoA-transferase